MGRPRTPSKILEFTGAFKKNPKRGREREMEPEPKAPVGLAPKHFKKDERAAWKYIVAIAPTGVLGDSDRAYLEVAARLFAYSRRAPVEDWQQAKVNRLETMLSKLGLNPADRSRVSAGGRPLAAKGADKGNPFAEF